jgi:hypothetical protein
MQTDTESNKHTTYTYTITRRLSEQEMTTSLSLNTSFPVTRAGWNPGHVTRHVTGNVIKT